MGLCIIGSGYGQGEFFPDRSCTGRCNVEPQSGDAIGRNCGDESFSSGGPGSGIGPHCRAVEFGHADHHLARAVFHVAQIDGVAVADVAVG